MITKDTKVCTACGSLTLGRNETPGSFLLEVILWCCAILPGLVYSLWRISSRRSTCPQCGGSQLVPINTPVGRRLAGVQATTEFLAPPAPAGNAPKKALMGVLFFLSFAVIGKTCAESFDRSKPSAAAR